MLKRLKAFLFPEPICTGSELRRYVSGQASYVAQRSTYEFTRNTLAWFGQAAFADKKFNEVFAVCRWEAFAAISADMLTIVRGLLAEANTTGALDPGLVRIYAEVLSEYPNPAHRAEGWADRHQMLLSRFSASPPDRAPDLQALGRATGIAIRALAPAHSNNADEERDVLSAAVTFGLVSFADRVERVLAKKEIARQLAASA
jgi:hypothetical protein